LENPAVPHNSGIVKVRTQKLALKNPDGEKAFGTTTKIYLYTEQILLVGPQDEVSFLGVWNKNTKLTWSEVNTI
jgi:hypothetical protein